MSFNKIVVTTTLALAAGGVQAQNTNAAEDLVRGVEMGVGKVAQGIFPESRFQRGTLIIPVSGSVNNDPNTLNTRTYIIVGRVRREVSTNTVGNQQNGKLLDTVGLGVGIKIDF